MKQRYIMSHELARQRAIYAVRNAPDGYVIHKAAPGADRANFRSATPMGFALAVYEANAPHLRKQLSLELAA